MFSLRALQRPRSGSKRGAPMIGSSSIRTSICRAISRSWSASAFHCASTDSTMRRRSFPKEILRKKERVAPDLIFRCSEHGPEIGIARDLDGLAHGEVLVEGDENRCDA